MVISMKVKSIIALPIFMSTLLNGEILGVKDYLNECGKIGLTARGQTECITNSTNITTEASSNGVAITDEVINECILKCTNVSAKIRYKQQKIDEKKLDKLPEHLTKNDFVKIQNQMMKSPTPANIYYFSEAMGSLLSEDLRGKPIKMKKSQMPQLRESVEKMCKTPIANILMRMAQSGKIDTNNVGKYVNKATERCRDKFISYLTIK